MNLDNAPTIEENKRVFIERLTDAGWSLAEALAEWESIQDDEEEGY